VAKKIDRVIDSRNVRRVILLTVLYFYLTQAVLLFRYLFISQGEEAEAKRELVRLRATEEEVDREMKEMAAEKLVSASLHVPSFTRCLRKCMSLLRLFFVSSVCL
jgi:hypothetical protein